MTNLDSILKSRDITLPAKVCLVKAMVFPVVIYGCESWIKKAEHQRIDAFALWCWRWLLRIPWTARRCNQSILKEISPEYSLKGLTLKLKVQYFGHLMWRTESFEKTLMLGKIEVRRRRGWQRMRWLDGITDSMDMSLSGLSLSWSWWRTGRLGVLQSMGLQKIGHDWATELTSGPFPFKPAQASFTQYWTINNDSRNPHSCNTMPLLPLLFLPQPQFPRGETNKFFNSLNSVPRYSLNCHSWLLNSVNICQACSYLITS